MKYGIVLYKDTDNIGDDILTYAAYRFLPRVDYVIDREDLDTFVPNKKESVATILNGWYLYNKFNWPPSEYIIPLFIGIHFSPDRYWGIKDEYLCGEGGEYLKKYLPIGCRDVETKERLQQLGIDAYFSGCLTLTIPRFENVENNGKIFLVDLPQNVCDRLVQQYGKENVEIVTHKINGSDANWEERKGNVEKLLKMYQGALAVVTTRLHCALPCLALGTKVLLVKREDQDFKNRFSTFEEYLNTCTFEDLIDKKINLNDLQNNKMDYRGMAESIQKKCIDFIKKVEKMEQVELPEISDFKEYWNRKAIWQKALIQSNEKVEIKKIIEAKNWIDKEYKALQLELHSVQKHSEEQERYIAELTEGNEYLKGQIEKQARDYSELQQWCEELTKAKEYHSSKVEIAEKKMAEIENEKAKAEQKLAEISSKKEEMYREYEDKITILEKKLSYEKQKMERIKQNKLLKKIIESKQLDL